MTPGSRPSLPAGGNTFEDVVRALLAGAWHAPCFLLFATPGCFYPGPLPDLVNNVPPDLIAAAVEDGQTISIGERGQRVFVIAQDDDGDELRFTWSLSRDGVLGTAQPIQDGSQVDLAAEEALDGQELSCVVYDTAGNALTLRWPLEVP